jgi:glycosyltransferase involved in cell wall biosynthesis
MRILIVSDSPLQKSAYGLQAKLLAQELTRAGHQVIYFGTTYHGETLHYDGLTLVGRASSDDAFGSGMMGHYATLFNADVILTVKDPQVYDPACLRALPVPWIAVCPVDTEPVSMVTLGALTFATGVITLTRQSQQLLAEQGVTSWYAPHMLDTAFWYPGDRAEARAKLGLSPTAFIAAFVGDNRTSPSRKSLDQVILAWDQFLRTHPDERDALLYLHTSLDRGRGGIDAERLIHAARLGDINWRASDQLLYESGNIGPDVLRDLYRAADVLLNPAMGGGFELTMIEAQACGTPVITNDFTAMRETAWSGWKISTQPGAGGGETVWVETGGFWFRPSRAAICRCLDMALASRDDVKLREMARAGALRYDTTTIMMGHWLPVMGEIEDLLIGADLGLEVVHA